MTCLRLMYIVSHSIFKQMLLDETKETPEISSHMQQTQHDETKRRRVSCHGRLFSFY